MTNIKPVLYAEDDDNDVFLMERTFKKLAIPNPLRIAGDGKVAVAYLSGSAPYQNREEYPLPCLLLMDLSMPGRHGLDVLRWVKTQASLSTLPVIVFTSSNQESDIHQSYLLGANGYVIKPGDPGHLLKVMKMIQEYWLSENRPSMDFQEYGALMIKRRPKGISEGAL